VANAEKILIVDDDQTTAKIVQLQLLKLGYPGVTIAKSGTEAIAMAQSYGPDLMLMDIKLGKGMDGIEAARFIMNQYQVPVVYLTAYSDEDLLSRAMETRPLGYVNKPLRETDLRTTIAFALERIKSRSSYQDDTYDPEPDDWKIICSCDMYGNVKSISSVAKRKLSSLGIEDITQILPEKHNDLVSLSLRSRRPQLVTGNIGEKIYLWEYVPPKRANKLYISIKDISFDSQISNPDIQYALILEVMDRLSTGLVLINENLKIYYKNRTAGKIIQKIKNLDTNNGYLSCVDPEITAELQRKILDGSDKILTIGGNSSLPLHILITPLKEYKNNYGQNLPISILFLYAGMGSTRLVEDILRSLYRLSRAEAKVTARLVKTPYLEEVAKSMGITYNTARTHLKRIYNKTQTNRISSLIHMITNGPVGVVLQIRD